MNRTIWVAGSGRANIGLGSFAGSRHLLVLTVKGVSALSDDLIAPHGGTLVDLRATSDRVEEIKAEARDWVSHDVTPRQLCDLELILNGAFRR